MSVRVMGRGIYGGKDLWKALIAIEEWRIQVYDASSISVSLLERIASKTIVLIWAAEFGGVGARAPTFLHDALCDPDFYTINNVNIRHSVGVNCSYILVYTGLIG